VLPPEFGKLKAERTVSDEGQLKLRSDHTLAIYITQTLERAKLSPTMAVFAENPACEKDYRVLFSLRK
jgi:hypothetical protein